MSWDASRENGRRSITGQFTMADIRSPRLLYLKSGLFVLLGCLAVAGILIEHPRWRVAGLLAIAIWAFARAYYFAFYVVEHYVDGEYKFAGLWSFIAYALRKKSGKPDDVQEDEN